MRRNKKIYSNIAFAANFFGRDRQKNEVDVVLENKVLFPIEVKFQTQITSSDLNGLHKFMEEFSLSLHGYSCACIKSVLLHSYSLP